MTYGIPAGQPDQEVPVCPRHPDRVSYVRCQRCGRPACPECQRPAAVGIQCVDCVHEAQRNAAVHKTVFGGAVRQGRPIVTFTIIGLCAILFLAQFVMPGVTDRLLYAGIFTSEYAPPEPWRMITSAFLHSTGFLLHIAFNMYALWIMGQALEPLLGRMRFIALYLIAAFGGSVAVLFLTNPLQGVLGASGAVFGLFGAMFIVQRRRGGDVRQLVVLIAINTVLGFVVENISWQAHLGGLLAGAAAAAIIAYAPRGKNRSLIQWTGLGALTLLLIILTFVGAQLISLPV
ncbi:rhomboid family intramembrane serine protease [Arthrobacter pigmenti]|uniref:rhomboid family intramembrane serine protease n=1 Tax=Arthrobacter pigmenti TaxID=271432 RepID=UPI00143B7E22|nr:rhomboid family intramembrane serine protease [Arthrobacter pigmenti]